MKYFNLQCLVKRGVHRPRNIGICVGSQWNKDNEEMKCLLGFFFLSLCICTGLSTIFKKAVVFRNVEKYLSFLKFFNF